MAVISTGGATSFAGTVAGSTFNVSMSQDLPSEEDNLIYIAFAIKRKVASHPGVVSVKGYSNPGPVEVCDFAAVKSASTADGDSNDFKAYLYSYDSSNGIIDTITVTMDTTTFGMSAASMTFSSTALLGWEEVNTNSDSTVDTGTGDLACTPANPTDFPASLKNGCLITAWGFAGADGNTDVFGGVDWTDGAKWTEGVGAESEIFTWTGDGSQRKNAVSAAYMVDTIDTVIPAPTATFPRAGTSDNGQALVLMGPTMRAIGAVGPVVPEGGAIVYKRRRVTVTAPPYNLNSGMLRGIFSE
jgi:hypothetical protein